ncbi:MAG: hypothetical protein EOP82_21560 [Variovorax sp.]|nr:MAG: hypothetical protein EOP82_21560 [Variovorax sp.]
MKRITLALPAPFVGLRPFTEKEALLFFGRDAHVRDLLIKLEQKQRFVAVLGSSGTGKSSLLRAGLIPALHRGGLPPRTTEGDGAGSGVQRWNVCIFQPGDAPLANLAHALIGDARWVDSADRNAAAASLASLLGASPLALADLYRQKADRFGDEALLLVVDQFEEIFRYHQRNIDEADSFVKLLLRSASEDLPIYVVMTMRSDFLGNAVAFQGLPEAINSGIYLTPRLGPDQIKSVIASPLSLVGGEIDPVLANRLVNMLGGEDELPILQHALMRMWHRARSFSRTRIEASDFEAVCAPSDCALEVGGTRRDALLEPMLSFAIDNHASEIYASLTSAQQPIARQFFLALVERRDGRDVRRPQTQSELLRQLGHGAQESLLAVIEAFRVEGVGFVLPAPGRPIGQEDPVDISHESLFRRWHLFQEWLDEEELDVAELREWQQRANRQKRGTGGWLDDSDCDRALRWRTRVGHRPRPVGWASRYIRPTSYKQIQDYVRSSVNLVIQARTEREQLKREAEEARVQRFEVEARMQREAAEHAEADRAQAEKDRESALAMARINRRRSIVAIIGGVAALVFGLIAAAFWVQASRALDEANQATQRAEAWAARAQAGELAATAESLAMDFPDRSVLLALEARRIHPVPKADALIRSASAAYPYRAALRGHEGSVWTARFSADDKTALTASDDKTARLWDVLSGKEILALRGHAGGVYSAEFSADGKTALTASEDKTARLWDVASGRELRAFRGHEDWIANAQFSADGKTVLTASADKTARLWDVASGHELRTLRGHGGAVTNARFSPDGKTVLTASDDKTARVWDVASGQELSALRGYGGRVYDAQYSADGKTVLTASADKTARLWDVASDQELLAWRGHEGGVNSVQFSADGKTVLTASDDKTARLWDVASGQALRVLPAHEGAVFSARFSADGKTMLTSGEDKFARLWDVASGRELRALRGHENRVTSAQFSADGKTVLTASHDKTARLWDVDSGQELLALRGHEGEVHSAQFSSDGKMVLTASYDKTSRLWDVASGRELLALRGHGDRVFDARFSADDKTVVTASDDDTARLWDVASGQELRTLRGHEGPVYSARFSADGKTVLTASHDDTARLWDVASGQELRALRGHGGRVYGAQFSADGKTVLTASADKTARLWDVASGKELRAFHGHEGGVDSARFSADGKTVLTASYDKTARLWDVASGRELRALRGHGGRVYDAQFSADGKTVLTASHDKTARLWDCAECRSADEVVPEVARKVGRELFEDERLQLGVLVPASPAKSRARAFAPR